MGCNKPGCSGYENALWLVYVWQLASVIITICHGAICHCAVDQSDVHKSPIMNLSEARKAAAAQKDPGSH